MRKQIAIKFSKEQLDKFIEDIHSCVTVSNSAYSLALFPYHLSDVSKSIKRLLNAKIAKYDKRLDAILLGYKNLKLITPYAFLKGDSCYIHVDIFGEFYLFKPKIGAKLTGIVNKISSNHVGCLVHKVFNVSVPNENEDQNWPGFNVQNGDIVELSVSKIQLDARLPYIMASINSIISSNKMSGKTKDLSQETTILNDDSPKKKKKKPHKSKEINNLIDNIKENLSQETSIKKQKKKRHSETSNKGDLSQEPLNLDNSVKKQKKKRNSIEMGIKMEKFSQEPLSLDSFAMKQKKKRHSTEMEIKTEDLTQEPLNLDDSAKKQNKLYLDLVNAEINETEISSESLLQETIHNDSVKKQKKLKRHREQVNGKIDKQISEINKSPNKTNETKLSTNESDYFVTPKHKKKQKKISETQTESNIVKDSMDDFLPKEKKSKKRDSKKHNESAVKKTETKSSKKKKTKQNMDVNDIYIKLLRDSLQVDQPQLKKSKKAKKHANKELRFPINISPIKPMADLEDRKSKKLNSSVVQSQSVIWDNAQLNLYDSDLEKTLHIAPEEKQTLELNLAKITALNDNAPRKRKLKQDENELKDKVETKKKSRKSKD